MHGTPDAFSTMKMIPMSMARVNEMRDRLIPFVIAAAVFGLDRFTKAIIRSQLSVWDSRAVIPGFFNIVHTENLGIAFGLLADSSGAWRSIFLIGLSVTVLVFITTVLLKPERVWPRNRRLQSGLALVLGGALGNLFDRIVTGTVTDFVEVYAGRHYFPAFNVADSAITIGAGLLLLDMWRSREKRGATAEVRR